MNNQEKYAELLVNTYEYNRLRLAIHEEQGSGCSVLLTTGIMLSGIIENMDEVKFEIDGTPVPLLCVANVLPEKQKKERY